MLERPPLAVHVRCSCGASLLVEASPAYAYDATQLMVLVRAWIEAHAPCAKPPVVVEGTGGR